MQFGKVQNPAQVDFTLPSDHPDTKRVLHANSSKALPIQVTVGCAKWNKKDLVGFYPRGTKDELHYYSRQFNAIELNATFYKLYSTDQYQRWYDKTPDGFHFFPKISQEVSHFRQLGDGIAPYVYQFLEGALTLKEKLGIIFLQLHANFSPTYFDRIQRFVEEWPKEIALAIEFRHMHWYHNATVAQELYQLMETHGITTVLTDTAGRRDLLHMKLTTPQTFIRYVGANHPSDYTRLDEWIERLTLWKKEGIQKIHFFIHQHIEKESPLLSAYFIRKLNTALNTKLRVPVTQDDTLLLF